ncbi:uncharacterized protein [Leptinotarsa decemlineata]|uniref:uncharacterized protein n=1 Tax=Leptinotarsa decemlineata TaxID=7539 RepID=UPI003D30C0D1
MSIRNLSEQFHTSKSTTHRIIREQLQHDWNMPIGSWISKDCMTVIHRVLFTDEAGFRRDRVINSPNFHIRTEENPHGILQTQYQRKFIVNDWAGIIGNHLIGPFVNDQLNGRRYLEFLQNDLNGLLEHVPLQTRRDRGNPGKVNTPGKANIAYNSQIVRCPAAVLS